MGKPKRRAMHYSIEELAFKHVMVHPNDKSGGIKAKMYRLYGKAASDPEIKKAQRIKRLLIRN